jgi:ribosomal protein S27AE
MREVWQDLSMALTEHRKEICRLWRERNRQRANEQNRAYYERYPERRHESAMNWRRANKEKRRAHRMVEYALAKGTLSKGPCENCGDPKAEAHHKDYSKPLDVNWLCRKCHGKEHRAA